jgi:hypothetical protein
MKSLWNCKNSSPAPEVPKGYTREPGELGWAVGSCQWWVHVEQVLRKVWNDRPGPRPYQKLYPHREDLRWFRIGSSTDWLEKRNAKSVIWAHDRAAVWGHCREYGRVRPDRAGAERATITRRDVRNGDATRRGVGLGRSCHRLEVGPSDVREHPCPARGECASRDSRRGSTPGGGTTSARSTR